MFLFIIINTCWYVIHSHTVLYNSLINLDSKNVNKSSLCRVMTLNRICSVVSVGRQFLYITQYTIKYDIVSVCI